ncbi:unnamed protein product [Rodentolepis nana]|uniref:BZIP domain-containing protein n=1 Tax=Rodentolepis nana TaxID=102285 RepID=A0A0R3T5V0_RODNA|nr:unnamed protein product [Rodentolepis nana]
MSRIRHFSLEQTSTQPERLPRLVPPPALSNPMSNPQRQNTGDTLDTLAPNIPPRYPGRRISEESTTRARHPSDQLTNSYATSSSPPQKYPRNSYDNSNTFTGAAADGRRSRNTNLPSVISGVAINSFQEECQSNGEDTEKRKRFNMKEFRQRRRDKRDSRNFSTSEPDSNAVSLTTFKYRQFRYLTCQNYSKFHICLYLHYLYFTKLLSNPCEQS